MAKGNFPFLSFNRGLLSPTALARVDLDRTRLSAEVYTNWLAKTQGAMTLRPGTKYLGSSLNDTGAEFLEFIASTDDVALIELSTNKMRVWLGDDAHQVSLLSRPRVTTTVSFTDTQGWTNASSGGAAALSQPGDIIPRFLSASDVNGTSVEAGSQLNATYPAWKAKDGDFTTFWLSANISSTSWWMVDFGPGQTRKVYQHALRAPTSAQFSPRSWSLQGNNVDTGTGWTTEVSVSAQTGWSANERRLFTDTGYSDTGANAWRYWRVLLTQAQASQTFAGAAEIEMFLKADTGTPSQYSFGAQGLTLNPTAVGSVAKVVKEVTVDTGVADTNKEHSLAINVARGPVIFRCGSSSQNDDYIRETELGTGYHNLAFTPEANFHLTFQNDVIADRIVASVAIGDSGTVELTTAWSADDLPNLRHDQSADVVFVDCDGMRPQKIERRGSGRSWSVVDYAPSDGPFLTVASSSAKMEVSHQFGNTKLNSSLPFFTPGHVGALMRIFHGGQSGRWHLGALDAATDAIEVTGISDTGTHGATNERRITVAASGSYSGTILIERSFDGADRGFKQASVDYGNSSGGDTGTFTRNIDDEDNNIKVWYRARMSSYSTGVAIVTITHSNGGVTGMGRITDFVSNQEVGIEVIRRFSDTGPSDNWQEGYWSEARSYPTAVALHGGRLAHAQGGSIFLTVADDYESFDDEEDGDAGPIIRTLGAGPVDSIYYLVSLLRLIVGTAGAELAIRSSSLDEPLTPDNASAGTFSTQGSANLRSVKMDNRALFVQRSGQRLFMVGAGANSSSTFGDYEGFELTLLVPELLRAGVVSIAVQRQPDTRIHCVLADGKVAILTYEPSEEVICWTMWQGDTGTNAAVEQAMVLPGLQEDAVFYHIRRTINGATKRYLEKWAKESECTGDSGLTFLMDCAKSYTDTGRTKALTDVATHLVGESVVAWGSLDTGSTPHVDLSPDVNGVQTRYTVDTGGDVTLSALTEGVHHGVVGLPYRADWKSAKLAYAAEAGTALAQMKTSDKLAFVLYKTHNNGLFFGNDTGLLDPLPRVHQGQVVDQDTIFQTFDETAMPFPGLWNTDSRICVRGKSPRPATILAIVPTVQTNEKV